MHGTTRTPLITAVRREPSTAWHHAGLAAAPLALVASLGLMVGAPTAEAANITIVSTAPSWSNTIGGTNVNTNNTGAGSATVFNVNWGTDIGNGQSGLGFDPVNPPSSVVPTDTLFKIGDLLHYNNAIAGGTAASSTQLNLSTTVQNAVPAAQLFSFQFAIDETTNSFPCAYPSNNNPCADKITFQNLTTTASFDVDGISYTLALQGFSTDGGTTISSDFISQEGLTNQTGLYAILTSVDPGPTGAPEPASLAVLGVGMLGLAALRRRLLG